MLLRDGPFDIPGGGLGFFFFKMVCFQQERKNKMSEKVCSSFSEFFQSPFPWSYKGLQITQKLSSIKYVDLLVASSVLNVNYKIRKIHSNICKD